MHTLDRVLAESGTKRFGSMRLPFSTSEAIESAVAELVEIERRTGIERTLAIGELILNRFFGGDQAVWHDRRRNKNNSVRRLAEHGDCPLGKSALNEAVGVYIAVAALPCVRTFGHISVSHVASVLRLPANERYRILECAERERWSVRELKQRVVSLRRAMGERRGRPAATGELRCLSALSHAASQLRVALCELAGIGQWSESAQAALRSVSSELSVLAARLHEQAAHARAEGPSTSPGECPSGPVAAVPRDGLGSAHSDIRELVAYRTADERGKAHVG